MLPSIGLVLSCHLNHCDQGPVERSLPFMLPHCCITVSIRIVEPLLKLSPESGHVKLTKESGLSDKEYTATLIVYSNEQCTFFFLENNCQMWNVNNQPM